MKNFLKNKGIMENITCIKGCCNLKICKKNQSADSATQHPFEKRKAGIFVWHQGKILVTQSHNSCWGIPKGSMEPYDDNPKSCAERELFEETGLNVTLKDSELFKILLGNCFVYKISIDNMDKVNLENLPNLDSTGLGWIYPGCAYDLNLNFLTRKLLQY
jgi:hypothetical protein